ncbi:MAG TPA: glutamyl-tRNA reductase [Chloroflexota bacterium]|nr:glutamyl-tRNA reductase [Chloroflexota bacterium]
MERVGTLVAIGLDYSSTPLSLREQISRESGSEREIASALRTRPAVDEAAVLNTCNRLEVYLVASDTNRAVSAVREVMLPRDEWWVRSRLLTETDAVRHLFRVAAGLESQSIGEAQILGQVSEALEAAQEAGTAGPILHALFRAAVSGARQARAGTELGRVDPSLASLAVSAAAEELGLLQGRPVLVVGGGKVSRHILARLADSHAGPIWIANRTIATAQELAAEYRVRAASLDDIPRLLAHVDIVFSATAAPGYVIRAGDIPAHRSLLLYDLAVPRDIDPTITGPDVTIRDLESLRPDGAHRWDADIRHIENVIEAEMTGFVQWYLVRRVVPVIVSLREHVDAVQQAELKRVAPRLADLTESERQAVESLTTRLIDKMFHHLVTRLRLAAQTDPRLVEAAEFFFLHGEGGLFEHAAETEREQETAP